jgi:uncharacterized protein involved in exopolysaccharide biosynthesis
MDQQLQAPLDNDEITFRDILHDVRGSKILLGSIVVACLLAGLAVGWLKSPQYQATTVLSPVGDESMGRGGSALGALASQYGGLASLAGINLANGASSGKDEAIAILQSEFLTERYVQENDLLPVLYARLWDPRAKKWTITDPEQIPTLWKANGYFKKIRSVVDDKKTGMIELTITWKDPKLAAKWANDLVRLTNAYLRDRAIREAARNIAYLNEQLAKTNVVEVQKSIYSLLETEINREMIARGRDEYAMRMVDPAFVPEKPSSLSMLSLGFLGAGIGCTLALLLMFARRAFFVDPQSAVSDH